MVRIQIDCVKMSTNDINTECFGIGDIPYTTDDLKDPNGSISTSGGSIRRKSRRSWFDKTPLPGIMYDIAVEKKLIRKVKPRKSEEDVETLLLTHFTNPPKIDFGRAKIGMSKRRMLRVKNPHDYVQSVSVEKFPYNKHFDIDETTFTVEANESIILTITWTPEDEGYFREMILFIVDKSYRLQSFVMGTLEQPQKKKKSVSTILCLVSCQSFRTLTK